MSDNNDYIAPGAMDPRTVNLATGNISLSETLGAIEGYELNIVYSSNIKEMVTTWNREAPTGVVGLGWALPKDRIVCIANGTGNNKDNQYLLNSGGAIYQMVCSDNQDSAVHHYIIKEQQLWKIIYHLSDQQWTIIKEDGTHYIYGDGTSLNHHATEWGIRWGNWIGASVEPEGQERYPLAWNLAIIENNFGEQVQFKYTQVTATVGTGILRYTQATYLEEVIGLRGNKLKLTYQDKETDEYQTSHQHRATYQERLETKYLSKVELLHKSGDCLSWVELGYSQLNPNSPMSKRVLTSIQEKNAQGEPYEPATTFDYYGLNSAEGVSVSLTSADNIFNASNGALFGAIKSVILPTGGSHIYRYDRQEIPGSNRVFDILSPTDPGTVKYDGATITVGWQKPKLFFGTDYVVIARELKSYQRKKTHLAVCQWIGGKWEYQELGIFEGHVYDKYHAMDYYDPTFLQTLKAKIFEQLEQIPVVKETLKILKDTTDNMVKTYVNVGTDLAHGEIGKAIKDFAEGEWNQIKTLVEDLWNGLKEEIENIEHFFVGLFGHFLHESAAQAYAEREAELKEKDDKYNQENPREEYHITLQDSFFALATSYAGKSVYVFHKDSLQPGHWLHHWVPVTIVSKHFQIASGDQFVAVLDQLTDILYTFTYDGEYAWTGGVQRLTNNESGAEKRASMTAMNNYLLTVVADARGLNTEFRLYHHEESGEWKVPTVKTLNQGLIPVGGSGHEGVTYLRLYPSNAFAALEVYNHLENGATVVENWFNFLSIGGEMVDRFVHRFVPDATKLNATYGLVWNKEFSDLEIKLLHLGTGEDGTQLVLAGDVINKIGRDHSLLVGNKGDTYAYRYDGIGFTKAQFQNDYFPTTFSPTIITQVVENSDKTKKITKFSRYLPNTLSTWEDHSNNSNLVLARLAKTSDGTNKWVLIDNITLEQDTPEFVEEAISVSIDILNMILMVVPFIGIESAAFNIAMDVANGVAMFGEPLADAIVEKILGGDHQSSSVAGDFILVGNKLFHRNSDETWSALNHLSHLDSNHELVGNHNGITSGFINYTVKDKTTQQYTNYVALLKNGRVYKTLSVNAHDLVIHPDSMAQTAGYKMFVAYGPISAVEANPDEKKHLDGFSKATQLQLYRVEDDQVTGHLTDYVVKSVEVNDGYRSTYMHYDYDERTASFSNAGQTAIYPKVLATPSGLAQISLNQEDIPTSSDGYTEHYFYNQQNYFGEKDETDEEKSTKRVGYPNDEDLNLPEDMIKFPTIRDVDDRFNRPISPLNGKPYLTRIFRHDNTEVAATRTYYQVTEQELLPLFGLRNLKRYGVLSSKTLNILDGVGKTTGYEYDAQNRLAVVETNNYTPDGTEEVKRTRTTYASEIYPGMEAANMLTQVAQRRTTYKKGDIQEKNVSTQLTTYKAWNQESNSFKLMVKGLYFNGTSTYINCTNNSKLSFGGTKSYTFEAWIKPEKGQADGVILSRMNRRVKGEYIFYLDNEGKVTSHREVNPWNMPGTTIVEVNTWYHIATTYEYNSSNGQGQLRVYVNGVCEKEQPFAAQKTNSVDVLIGAWYNQNSPNRFFKGFIRDVVIWSTARTAEQIEHDMHVPPNENETGLVCYWPLNEGEGEQANDHGPHHIQGAINHGVWQDVDHYRRSFAGQTTYVAQQSTASGNAGVNVADAIASIANQAALEAEFMAQEAAMDEKLGLYKQAVAASKGAADAAEQAMKAVHDELDALNTATAEAALTITELVESNTEIETARRNVEQKKIDQRTALEAYNSEKDNLNKLNGPISWLRGEIHRLEVARAATWWNLFALAGLSIAIKARNDELDGKLNGYRKQRATVNQKLELYKQAHQNLEHANYQLKQAALKHAQAQNAVNNAKAAAQAAMVDSHLAIEASLHAKHASDQAHHQIARADLHTTAASAHDFSHHNDANSKHRHASSTYQQSANTLSQISGSEQNLYHTAAEQYRNLASKHNDLASKHLDTHSKHDGAKEKHTQTATGATEYNQAVSAYNNKAKETVFGWIKTHSVTQRDSATGLPLETSNVDNVNSSVLYDQDKRFLIAQFNDGRLQAYEVGYQGFESYEETAFWQREETIQIVSVTDDILNNTHAAYSTQSYTISAQQFNPIDSPETIPYVISAWVKPINDQAIQVGVKEGTSSASSITNEWQYIEHVVDEPTSEQVPEVRCPHGGYVHHVVYRPISTVFSAAVYDEKYHLPLLNIGNNGQLIRYIYGNFQQLVTTISNDGTVGNITRHTYSRGISPTSGTYGYFARHRPNSMVTISAFEEGIYVPTWNETQVGQLELSDSFAVYLKVSGARQDSVVELSKGDLKIRYQSGQYTLLKKGTGIGYPYSDTEPNQDWLLVYTAGAVLFYCGGHLILKDKAFGEIGPGNLQFEASMATITCTDIVIAKQVDVTMAFFDGLNRLIQIQNLYLKSGHVDKTVVRETRYDGWGHPAVNTLPAAYNMLFDNGVSFVNHYNQDHLRDFNWKNGVMSGGVSDYYRPGQEGYEALYQVSDADYQFPYTRQTFTHSPLARPDESALPGEQFKIGTRNTIKTVYQSADGENLMNNLEIDSQNQPHFKTQTSLLPLPLPGDPEGKSGVSIARDNWGQTVGQQTHDVWSSTAYEYDKHEEAKEDED
jgi:hypothetical protein